MIIFCLAPQDNSATASLKDIFNSNSLLFLIPPQMPKVTQINEKQVVLELIIYDSNVFLQ